MGYCYLSPAVQQRFTPINAGWKAGAVPLDSFFGPEMTLSTTASRFDNSISWLAAMGNETALTIFDDFGPETIYARNHELTTTLRAALADAGCAPFDLPEGNRSTIVTIPLGDLELSRVVSALSEQGVIVAARDGNLRISIHFYNHEDDIRRLATTLGTAVR
jgi:selenocysteine lyase/cysteine desulfurase